MARFFEIIEHRTQSSHNGEPLNICSICECPLDPNEFYLVAKAYHRGDCILESAQCMACQMESRNYASAQSLENIMLYSGRRFNQYLQDPLLRESYHLEEPSCLITGEPLTPADTFELYCFHVPNEALGEQDFFWIGPTAIEQMSELLSEETRKSWGRFTDQLEPQAPDIVVSPMFIG